MIKSVLSLVLLAVVYSAPTQSNDASEVVPGEFIVGLKMAESMDSSSFIDDHLQRVFGLAASADSTHNPVLHKYSFGYAAKMDDQLKDLVRAMPEVDIVEPNYVGHVVGKQANPPNWGLKRIAQRKEGWFHWSYSYPDHAGKDTTVYIIDTGVDVKHSEFKRSDGTTNARHGVSFVRGVESDDHGHGTHVGSTVGGLLSGVAKSAEVVGVKVCDWQGRCTVSAVIAGVEFAMKDRARRGRTETDIANMSLGWSTTITSLERSMKAATDSGILFAVAAGNSFEDACYSTPAQYSFVVTVAASAYWDFEAPFTNYGRCCDLYAPGVFIKAGIPGNKFESMSGTSMASPHVAGALALLATGHKGAGVNELKKLLLDQATTGVVKVGSSHMTTPNKLLYVNPK
ncbi:hypothetical protein MP228_003731 [Amoeboaphelidium protococcarum]|nr:hypothetical protein MP228_003731 [Amoeboaphelidium protococcarum]